MRVYVWIKIDAIKITIKPETSFILIVNENPILYILIIKVRKNSIIG